MPFISSSTAGSSGDVEADLSSQADGVTTDIAIGSPFQTGSLKVYWFGELQNGSSFIASQTPATGHFTISAPVTATSDARLMVYYKPG